MKPRKVIITLEATTRSTLAELRHVNNWGYAMRHVFDGESDVCRVQVNVVKPPKEKAR